MPAVSLAVAGAACVHHMEVDLMMRKLALAAASLFLAALL
jgi:hypothetical protein